LSKSEFDNLLKWINSYLPDTLWSVNHWIQNNRISLIANEIVKQRLLHFNSIHP